MTEAAELIARLKRAAKNASETLDWLANHEDAGSTPVWEAQAEYEEDAKAILEAADHIETLEARVATLSAENSRLSETYIDESGLSWSPPTAWAYFAVCRARDAHQSRADRAEEQLRAALEAALALREASR